MTSADDFRHKTLQTDTFALKLLKRTSVSSSFCLFRSLSAWWGRQNAQFYLGERNCSAGKIVGRNPDDSGQVTVNQRTTTPLFKVIIRDR